MLDEKRLAEIEQRAAKATPSCKQCGDRGTYSIRVGTSYETDSDEERALAWREVDCPMCGNFMKRSKRDIPDLTAFVRELVETLVQARVHLKCEELPGAHRTGFPLAIIDKALARYRGEVEG